MAAPQTRIEIGDVLDGRYELLARIGAGGMGEVFRAQDLNGANEVAIKVLLNLDSDSHVRFEREAKATSLLAHPNIVSVLAFETSEEGPPYIVLEYLEGEDLACRLTRGTLSIEESGGILRQLCSGLSAAHEAGIIHRDLKPANIFLCPSEGPIPQVKILDFGVSKLSGAATLTQENTLLGTPQYMSPEQMVMDNHLLRPATDVFALGTIVYEMLAGTLCFSGENLNQLIFAVVYTEPRPLRELRPDLPTGVYKAVEAALLKDPERRYSDVLDFHGAFHAGAEGRDWDYGDAFAAPESVEEARSANDLLSTRQVRGPREAMAPIQPELASKQPSLSRRIALGLATLVALVFGTVMVWPAGTSSNQKKAAQLELGDEGLRLASTGEPGALEALSDAFVAGDDRVGVIASLLSRLQERELVLAEVGDGEIVGATLHPHRPEFVYSDTEGQVVRHLASGKSEVLIDKSASRAVRYSQSGDLLAIGDDDFSMTIMSGSSVVYTVPSKVVKFLWMPNPDRLLTLSRLEGNDPKRVLTLHSRSGKQIWSREFELEEDAFNLPGFFAARANRIVFVFDGKVLLIDPESGETTGLIQPGSPTALYATAVAIDRSGQRVAVAYSGGQIVYEDINAGKRTILLMKAASLAFGGSGILTVGLADGLVASYRLGTSNLPIPLASTSSRSPKELFCESDCVHFDETGLIRFYNPSTGREIESIQKDGYTKVVGVKGQHLLLFGNGRLLLLAHRTASAMAPLAHGTDRLIPSSDKLSVLRSGADNGRGAESDVVRLSTGRITADILTSPEPLFVADARWVARGRRIYDMQSSDPPMMLPEGLSVIGASEQAPAFVATSSTGALALVDAKTGALKNLEFGGKPGLIIPSVLVSADATRFVILQLDPATGGGALVTYKLGAPPHSRIMEGGKHVRLSPSGEQLATIAKNKMTIRRFDDQSLIVSINLGSEFNQGIERSEFLSETEVALRAISSDRTRVIDLHTQKWREDWSVCDMVDLHVPPRSPLGVALCVDGVLRVFEVSSKSKISDYKTGHNPSDVRFSLARDGSMLVSEAEEQLQVYHLLPTDLTDFAKRLDRF